MEQYGFLVFVALACVVVAIIVGGAIYAKIRAERKVSAAFQKVAAMFDDGVLTVDTWRKRIVRFSHQGLDIELAGHYSSIGHASNPDRAKLTIAVDWPVANVNMELNRRNVFNSVSSYMFGSRVLTGELWLDRYYTITGSPKEDIQNMLAPSLHALLEVSRILGSAILEIKLHNGVLTIGKRFPGRSFAQLKTFLEKSTALLESLALISAVGVEFVESQEPTQLQDVVCKICGDTIDRLAVKCASCKTIHHHECWEYAGVCSTYGCGQTKYLPITAVDV